MYVAFAVKSNVVGVVPPMMSKLAVAEAPAASGPEMAGTDTTVDGDEVKVMLGRATLPVLVTCGRLQWVRAADVGNLDFSIEWGVSTRWGKRFMLCFDGGGQA